MRLNFKNPLRGKSEHFDIEKTIDGWEISYMRGPVNCDKYGKPLISGFQDFSIETSDSVGFKLEALWEEADFKKLTEQEIQERLDQIGRDI